MFHVINSDGLQDPRLLGEVGDLTTHGADRSPDAAWIKGEQKEKFPPISPDFVIELLSPSDSLKVAQEKMREYLDNGVRLGLLINRKSRQVEIYRQGQKVEVLDSPATLSGENI